MGGSKLPITTEIYNIIKEQIVSLAFMPNQILMVQQLAKDYNVSRTPVREALIRLKDEGLVDEAAGNKFRVSEITWKFIKDLYMARITVERTAVAFAAVHITDTQYKQLEKFYHVMEKCVDTDSYTGYFAADMEFHQYFLQIMGNDVIKNWMERITDQQQRIRYLTMGISSSMSNSLSEHREILNAVKNRDEVSAMDLAEEHLKRALNDILNLKNSKGMSPVLFIKD